MMHNSHNLETCRCPEVISTNYYAVKPYNYYSEDGKLLIGVFPQIIDDMISYVCGKCQRSSGFVDTRLDKFHNGRNALAMKSNAERAVREIDEYTDLSFPIIAQTTLDMFTGYPFIPLINHPGVVVIAKDKSIDEIVADKLMLIFAIWPLMLINVLFMVLAGFIVWVGVSIIVFCCYTYIWNRTIVHPWLLLCFVLL